MRLCEKEVICIDHRCIGKWRILNFRKFWSNLNSVRDNAGASKVLRVLGLRFKNSLCFLPGRSESPAAKTRRFQFLSRFRSPIAPTNLKLTHLTKFPNKMPHRAIKSKQFRSTILIT